MMTGVTAPGGGSPNHVDEASAPVTLGGGGRDGEEKTGQGRKMEEKGDKGGNKRKRERDDILAF